MKNDKLEKKLLITNNPKIKETHRSTKFLADKFELIFLNSRDEVFTTVRDYIHNNWKLLNHAMAGNIPLHKHPYRTMTLEKIAELDTKSLLLWESAMERVKRGKCPPYPQDVLEDFQELDLQLISDTIYRI